MAQTLDQNPHVVVMVRPLFFSVNEETAADNAFQAKSSEGDAASAVNEFDTMVGSLRAVGAEVVVFDQASGSTPDAVFPNNWFSTHHDGRVVLYPMAVPSRRAERRKDIVDSLLASTPTSKVLDLSHHEHEAQFLEGTGAIVFDHEQRIAFLARSGRADADLLSALCGKLDYQPMVFDAVDRRGTPIYHTNVMMAVGQRVALLGSATIGASEDLAVLKKHLAYGDRLLVELNHDQIESFAGNALEIDTADGPVLVMSARGWASLSPNQQQAIEARLPVVTPSLPTIEKSGGSARCMMAGVHLPKA